MAWEKTLQFYTYKLSACFGCLQEKKPPETQGSGRCLCIRPLEMNGSFRKAPLWSCKAPEHLNGDCHKSTSERIVPCASRRVESITNSSHYVPISSPGFTFDCGSVPVLIWTKTVNCDKLVLHGRIFFFHLGRSKLCVTRLFDSPLRIINWMDRQRPWRLISSAFLTKPPYIHGIRERHTIRTR